MTFNSILFVQIFMKITQTSVYYMMDVTKLVKHVGSEEGKGSTGTPTSFIIMCYMQQLLRIHIKGYYPNRPGPGNFLVFKKMLSFTDLHHVPRHPLDRFRNH